MDWTTKVIGVCTLLGVILIVSILTGIVAMINGMSF